MHKAQKCLDEKVGAAVQQSYNNADLKSAVLDYYVVAMSWVKDYADREARPIVEEGLQDATAKLMSRGRNAGVWH